MLFDRVGLAFIRVFFFLMLFVSTAFAKADHRNQGLNDTPAPAVAQENTRRHDSMPRDRAGSHDAGCLAVDLTAADFGVPGDMNWD
jgi:hypothetical protein